MLRSRLFVYGTLKRGCASAQLMRGATFEGSAATVQGYALYDLGDYPALVAHADGVVQGEVYLVTPDHLAELDRYEGCPELYRRELVNLADGSRAETYLMAAAGVAGRLEIAGGVWPAEPPPATF